MKVSYYEDEYLCNEMYFNRCDIHQSGDDVDRIGNNYGNRLLTLCKTLHHILFSNLINDWLTRFVNENKIIGPEQVGFRSGFSMLDYILSIKTLINTKYYITAM